ncbi:DUF2182 domain-containing protein [Streptomyces gobiensis]|uniref:DUF2182 domain-containing protein n=1 Tax=Streptomyces gobiensis TaxID=2875706 RepID=UPI001E31B7CD|nr:DUF2182 domain-containing protein [Streptomyces gobiensis]UGY91315.1 DUF2182 domain-containing protein [Streptomyces gobiensis]
MGESRSAAASEPPHRGSLLPARELGVAWSLLAVIAALAWLLTIWQAHGRMAGHGAVVMSLPLFVLLWVVMMAAMMLPSVAPVAITWARGIRRQSGGLERAARTAEFTAGYLLAWTAFGLGVYGLLAATGELVRGHPGAGRWIGSGAFALAGLYQLSPFKTVCLRHCRSPMGQLLYYARFRRWARDFRVGAHHGLYCVGCCWGLMIVLIPLGVMNIAAMAAVAAAIFAEKLWRLGAVFSTVVGLAFLTLAVLTFSQSWLLPGLAHAGS